MWNIPGGLILTPTGSCFPHTVMLTTGSLRVSAVLSQYITAASSALSPAVTGTGRLVLSERPVFISLSLLQPGALSLPGSPFESLITCTLAFQTQCFRFLHGSFANKSQTLKFVQYYSETKQTARVTMATIDMRASTNLQHQCNAEL